MGTGWRRAFCTTIQRDREAMEPDEIPSPRPVRSRGKLGIFSSISNSSTPRFNSGEAFSADNTPRLHCKVVEKKAKTPIRKLTSNPSSPRSPFSILKNTLRLSKSGCGVCLQSVKTGQGMAIYTAECTHSFHFPCIAQHVRKQGSLVCPVCNCTWKDVPLLSAHKKTYPLPDQDDVVEKAVTTTSSSFEDNTIQSSISPVKISCNHSKPFDDDEPLLTPVAGARFNPIPEAEDEDKEDDVQEFQGFFVNATPSTTPVKKYSTSAFLHGRRIQRNVDIKLLPEAASVTTSRSHETVAVVLRVKAPPPPPFTVDGGVSSQRAPIDLVTVLDVSSSMNNAKIQMLKRATKLLISSLRSSDRLSIVAFSSSPQRLLPLCRMSHQGQRLARRMIDRLSIGQGKSVNEALTMGAKILEDRREKNPVASIILLSDGQDQLSGFGQRQSTGPISKSNSTSFGHIEIPLHESVTEAFAKRVGGLLSVVVKDLRLQLGFSSGEITAVYSCNGRPTYFTSDSIKLGDMYAEEERELLVELRIPTSAAGAHHVMAVRCSYKDPATGEAMYGRERGLLVPRPHASRSTDPRIERLRNIFVATRAVAETRRLVEVGEFGTAQKLLMSARGLVAQSKACSSEEYVRWLETELAAIQRQEAVVKLQHTKRIGKPHVSLVDENGEPLTPTSAWRAAEQLAKFAVMKNSLNKSGDLHGFENARF